MRGPDPKFKEGDRVIDFRGDKAVVIRVTPSPDWQHKSHRVEVNWDDDRFMHGPYYEEVFSRDD